MPRRAKLQHNICTSMVYAKFQPWEMCGLYSCSVTTECVCVVRCYWKMCCYASEVGTLLYKTTRAQNRHLQMGQTRKNRPRNLCRIGHTWSCTWQRHISERKHACITGNSKWGKHEKTAPRNLCRSSICDLTVKSVKVIGPFLNVCMLYEAYNYQRFMSKYFNSKWNTVQCNWNRHVVL